MIAMLKTASHPAEVRGRVAPCASAATKKTAAAEAMTTDDIVRGGTRAVRRLPATM
jgi:hypothetical protein